jgi:predicted permease
MAVRTRTIGWLTDLVADARYALRTFVRQPAFTLVAIVSLAAGIGLNTTVFSIINTIFLQSLRGVPEPDRVVSVGQRVAFTAFREVRDTTQSMGAVAAWQPIQVDIEVRGVVSRRVVPAVSEGYFDVMRIAPARGQFFDRAATRQPAAIGAVVLDHEFWTRTLGADPNVLGEMITVNGVAATVVGIAPESFHGIGPERPPLWIPMGMVPLVRSKIPQWDSPAETGWRIIGRLRDGVSLAQVNSELKILELRQPALFPSGALFGTVGPERWSGPVSAEKRIEFLLVVVLPLVVVALILWIGCSNVANLLLARAASRRKEIAIRLANGASRARVIRLLLTESLLLAAGGGALGLLASAWTLDLAWAILPEVPRLAVEIDAHVLIYTTLVCVFATILFGLVPAIQATRVDVSPVLKGEETGARHAITGGRVRSFFLVTQFASSMALLLVAGTFVRTLVATHVGEQSALIDHLAVASLETKLEPMAARAEYWRGVRAELRRVPGVESVTLLQADNGGRAKVVAEGRAIAEGAEVSVQKVDGEFFKTLGLRFVSGRDEFGSRSDGPARAVVNERAARSFWGTTEAVGKRLAIGDASALEIAGVVADDGAEPRVFLGPDEGAIVRSNILIRTADRSSVLVETLRTTLARSVGAPVFVRVSTFREASAGGLERLTALAVGVGAIVLSLAAVGLYGSISFVTSMRTREIAIRMALGAPRPAVLRLLAREGMLVVALGSLLGLTAAAIAFRFMSGMIFARWTVDPLTVAGVLAAFALTTLGACYVPGRRAIRIDPMRVLRAD